VEITLRDTSKIRINFNAKIPLYGRASGIVLADTFAIDLSDCKELQCGEWSNSGEITNELPLDAFIQLYLVNENAVIYDSLFTTAQTAIVKASTVNAQGDLQSASNINETIDIANEKLNKIFDAKKIIVRAKMNTSKDSGGNLVDVKFKAATR